MMADRDGRLGALIGDRLASFSKLLPRLVLAASVAWLGLRLSELLGTELFGFENSPVSGILMSIVVGLTAGNFLSLLAWI